MQQQRSQEDSYIHKTLIANINLGPCTETKTLHNSYKFNYVYKQQSYITTQESRVRRFKLFEKRMFE